MVRYQSFIVVLKYAIVNQVGISKLTCGLILKVKSGHNNLNKLNWIQYQFFKEV